VTALTITWAAVALGLVIVSLIIIVCAIKTYLEERSPDDPDKNAEMARGVSLSFLGPLAAILWPLTLAVALVYGGYRLIKTMREDLKANKQNQTSNNN
jgi:hypothetical protein